MLTATARLRDRVVGVGQPSPLLDGRMVPYVNLDNAATTPPLKDAAEAVARFLPYYSSVHRGSGFKSRLSTMVYDQAHETIARFVGADPETNTVIFGKNTTDAVNKLSYRIPLDADSVVITTIMEHHSNDLPWRNRARVVHAGATPDGRLDEEDFERQLQKHAGHIALVAVTAASNVSGYIQPVHRLAGRVHEVGAKIMVDAAQLAPHRQVEMKPDDDPQHLDFVAIAGHKMYAPFGTGALVGSKDFFLQAGPEYPGATRPGAPTWSAPWPWPKRPRCSWTWEWTTSPLTRHTSRPTRWSGCAAYRESGSMGKRTRRRATSASE